MKPSVAYAQLATRRARARQQSAEQAAYRERVQADGLPALLEPYVPAQRGKVGA